MIAVFQNLQRGLLGGPPRHQRYWAPQRGRDKEEGWVSVNSVVFNLNFTTGYVTLSK